MSNTKVEAIIFITIIICVIVCGVLSFSSTTTEKTSKIIGKRYSGHGDLYYLVMENGDTVATDWKEYAYFTSEGTTITYTKTVTFCYGISYLEMNYNYGEND